DVRLALERLEQAPETVATLEVRAMACIRQQDFAEADRYLSRAKGASARAEELARLEFLTGRVAHARHQYDGALECFARAADSAVRAGAVLEEATYLRDRKSTRLNSSHVKKSYAVYCMKKNRYDN